MNDELLRYVAGALAPEDEAAFEARLFGAGEDGDALAADAAHLLAVRDALAAMAQRGPIVPVVTAAELRALAASGAVAEHHPREGALRLRSGGEPFIAAHVPLTSVPARVHVAFCAPDGTAYFRVNEAPLDPAAGEIIVLCERHVAAATARLVIRVLDDDDAVVGEVAIDNGP